MALSPASAYAPFPFASDAQRSAFEAFIACAKDHGLEYEGPFANSNGTGVYLRLAPGEHATHAFEVPATLPPRSLHNLLTVFLDPSHGSGGILNVVNDAGGPSTIANPDVPVTVVSYP